jgi:proteasome lid subunit RPN8/RPN11
MDAERPTITLSAATWRSIADHAAAALPDECCGALTGLRDDAGFAVHSAHACPNRAPESRHNSFLIDPEDILAIRRLALDNGLDLIGFYHSHPGKTAYFSDRDLRECWPGYANLVVSVLDQGEITAKAYIAGSGRRSATEIEVVMTAGAFRPSSAVPPR